MKKLVLLVFAAVSLSLSSLSGDDFIAKNAAAVTPSDGSDLPVAPTVKLYVGGAGNLSVDLAAGNTAVVFNGVPAGTVLPLAVKRVRSTGTTATNIVALYQ